MFRSDRGLIFCGLSGKMRQVLTEKGASAFHRFAAGLFHVGERCRRDDDVPSVLSVSGKNVHQRLNTRFHVFR